VDSELYFQVMYAASIELGACLPAAIYALSAVFYDRLYGEHSWLPLGPSPHKLYLRSREYDYRNDLRSIRQTDFDHL
jgi:hypothetical protein